MEIRQVPAGQRRGRACPTKEAGDQACPQSTPPPLGTQGPHLLLSLILPARFLPAPPNAADCLALCSLPCGKARFQRPASACGGKPSPAAAAALISCSRNNQPGAWHLVFAKSLQLLVPVTYHTSQHLISGWAEGMGFAARWQLPGGQTTLFMDGAWLVGTGGAALFHCFWTS